MIKLLNNLRHEYPQTIQSCRRAKSAASATIALLCITALNATAHAADATLARNLVANCANCHGTDGKALPGAGMTSLAGMPKATLLKKFKEFRSGVLPATVMHQIAKGYTDEQIELIATYLTTQK